MKKKYITLQMETVELRQQCQILAGSVGAISLDEDSTDDFVLDDDFELEDDEEDF